MNLSLGGSANSGLDSVILSASKKGHLVTVAAGNLNADACRYSPGRSGGNAINTGIFNVGATQIRDEKAYYSNWGTCVDIMAPGTNVLSASHRSNSGVVPKTGTSMAAPHVAGVLATLLEKHDGNNKKASKELLEIATAGVLSGIQRSTPNLLLRAVFGHANTPCPTLPLPKFCRQ